MSLNKKKLPIVKRRIFTLNEDISLLKSCVNALADYNSFKLRYYRTSFWNTVFLYFCKENQKNKTVRHLRKRCKVLYKYLCKKKEASVETVGNTSENQNTELKDNLFNHLLLVVFKKVCFNSKGCIEFRKITVNKTHKTLNFTNTHGNSLYNFSQNGNFAFFGPYKVSFSLDIVDEWTYFMRTNQFLRKLNKTGIYLTAAETMKMFDKQITKKK